MSHVKAFKLVGGEEVVATVVEEVTSSNMLTENTPASGTVVSYVVRKPHILKFQPVAPGQIGLAFVPWTLSNPTIERLEIPATAVILTFSPSDQVEQQYLEQTSGIELVRGSGFKL